MSERTRGRNGAEKRYKGPRELVGTRVPPQVTDRVDEEREALGLTRNDFIYAAILLAVENPDGVRAAAATLNDMRPSGRINAGAEQLRMLDGSSEEVFAQSA